MLKLIIIGFLFLIEANAFLWNNYSKLYSTNSNDTISGKRIDYFFLLQEKGRLENLKEVSSFTLKYTNNDTLSNKDVLTMRNVENLNTIFNLSNPISSPRERDILNSIEVGMKNDMKNVDILNPVAEYDCNDIVSLTTLRDKNISLSSCLQLTAKPSSFYGVGVNRIIVSNNSNLLRAYDRITFNEFKVPFEKIRLLNQEQRKLIDKIPYLDKDVLEAYVSKYFESNISIFIPIKDVCKSMENRFNQLMADPATSSSDKIYLTSKLPIVQDCPYNYFDSELALDEVSELNCTEYKASIDIIMDRLSSQIVTLDSEIDSLTAANVAFQATLDAGGLPPSHLIALRDNIRDNEISISNKQAEKIRLNLDLDKLLDIDEELGTCS